MMTKKDLMTGDIVVERGGYLAVVIKTEAKDEYLLYSNSGYDYLEDYNDDLTYKFPKDNEDPTDIMQVYRAPAGGISFVDYEDEEPIYERDCGWTKPTEEEMAKAEAESKAQREQLMEDEKEKIAENKKNLIDIIAQHFYGNRTGTTINRNDVDRFILGYMDESLMASEPIDRTVVKVPRTDNLVVIYNKYQEDEYINVDFPRYYAEKGEEYKERWGEELKPHISCEIPEINFKIHTRCIVCRIDENGILQSLEEGDAEKFIRYFPAK